MTFTNASPPRNLPTKSLANANNFLEISVLTMISAASMKNGIDIRINEFTPVRALVGSTCRKDGSIAMIYTIAVNPME